MATIETTGEVRITLEESEKFDHVYTANGYKFSIRVDWLIWEFKDEPVPPAYLPVGGKRTWLNPGREGQVDESWWTIKVTRLPRSIQRMLPTGLIPTYSKEN